MFRDDQEEKTMALRVRQTLDHSLKVLREEAHRSHIASKMKLVQKLWLLLSWIIRLLHRLVGGLAHNKPGIKGNFIHSLQIHNKIILNTKFVKKCVLWTALKLKFRYRKNVTRLLVFNSVTL